MKRENIIWLGVFAAFVFFCFYMRWEMQSNRAKLSAEIHQEIKNAPANLLDAVNDTVKKTANTLDPGQNGSNGQAASAIGDITDVVKRTIDPGSSNSTTATNMDLGALGVRVLDAATHTAQRIDRIGLDATRMTDQQESDLGVDLDKEFTHESHVVADSPEYPRINRLMAPILDERQRKEIHYTFRVIDSKTVNAFSLAGGYVYVTTGFLREFPGDASLVMALSHEIGHVDLRHCAEKVQYMRVGSQAVGDLASIGGAVYNALSTPYTKEQEFAADEYGFNAARKAGWNAPDLIALFTQLDAYEHREGYSSSSDSDSELGSKLKNYFSSHPPTIDRRQRLEKLAAK